MKTEITKTKDLRFQCSCYSPLEIEDSTTPKKVKNGVIGAGVCFFGDESREQII
nr:hypothetical protein [uncultured Flavobacterium sp.]